MLFLELPKIWNTKKQKESFNLLLIANRKWVGFLFTSTLELTETWRHVMNDKGIGSTPPKMPNKFRNLQCKYDHGLFDYIVSFMRSLPTLFREKIFPGWWFHFFSPQKLVKMKPIWQAYFSNVLAETTNQFQQKGLCHDCDSQSPNPLWCWSTQRERPGETQKKSPPIGDSGYTHTHNLPLPPRKYSHSY